MTVVSFPNWKEVLDSSDLESGVRKSFEISIKWYLGYLGKHKEPATVENARRFVREMVSERRPADWMVEQWREALNWFFRNAPRRRRCASMAESTGKPRATAERKAVAKVGAKIGSEARFETKAGMEAEAEVCVEAEAEAGVEQVGDGRRRYAVTIREYQESVAWEPWIEETVRLMRVRQMAYRTEETYIGWMRRIARFGECRGKSLEDFGEGDLKDFLSYLAVEEGVSASTQRQALNAGVFFLREVRKLELGDFSDFVKADPRKYYPVVYTREEMGKVLACMRETWQLMARLQYGCGLRISELCRLRVKDVDLGQGKLFVRAGKGEKDRVVPLPRSIHEDWERHLERIRPLYEQDRAANRPGVYMPPALGRKFSRASSSWEWFWAFPAKSLSRDPREPTAPLRRHHVLPGVYQRHLSEAAGKAGIPKRSNSHILRHSYATHLLESGVNIRTVQECLGHASVETTMIYLHVMRDEADRLVSPLDNLN